MHQLLLGMTIMGCLIAGLFFLRFWRKTRERLFAIFAAAFWLLGLDWLLLAFSNIGEATNVLFLLRLLAFLLILLGIIDKNRAVKS